MRKEDVKELNTISGNSNNAYRAILPVAGELVFLFFFFFMAWLLDPSLELTWFHDPVGQWLVYGSTLIILLIAGVFPDFLRSFIYSFKQPEEITAQMVKSSLFSIKLAMITAAVSQVLAIVIGFVSMIYSAWLLSDGMSIVITAPALLVLGGSAIHGILVFVILLPVYARLKVRLISMQ